MVTFVRIAMAVMMTISALGLSAGRSDAFPVATCVNLGNALDAPREGDWGPPITFEDLVWIANQGFDTVRLPVRFSGHWDGRIDPQFLRRVDEVIAQARSVGLQVILDLHHFDGLMADPVGQAPVFHAIWTELAQHYAGHDNGLVFELLNEPRGALGGERLHALYAAIIPEIRRHNPERWIILGGGNSNDLNELAALPIPDGRIALTFHYYEPYVFTHQQAEWIDIWFPASGWGTAEDVAAVRADFDRIPDLGAPIFLGEFGVYERADPVSRMHWTRVVREAAEARGIAWCHWAYRAGFDIVDARTGDWTEGMRDALFGPTDR
ncbi:glycoside hydrolase family 5 protein [Roseicyclus marinus]|uniref:glycoside hydrolase family 5 protein n=1 Tax=Roseicyclus marinus TaxID=2161673 RepID=UPI00240FE6DC|nr:glycoside hydrolase family 5 protein [Roseicyclus marinus]MDG3039780.1 glycoside hydrolase family 5 protein [Roseicyclus marinus]